MANVMVKTEQINYLPFVLPLNELHDIYAETEDNTQDAPGLAKLLTNHLRSHNTALMAAPQATGDKRFLMTGQHPGRLYLLTKLERKHLRSYIRQCDVWLPANVEDETTSEDDKGSLEQADVDNNNRFVGDNNIPTKAALFSRAVYKDGFIVIPSRLKRSNSTCTMAHVEYHDPNLHLTDRAIRGYCEVLMFVSLMSDGIHHEEKITKLGYLAYINELNVEPCGNLLRVRISSAGHRKKFIEASWILGLIGIFVWQGDSYIVKKSGSLLFNNS
ncbi:hypothetical protein EDC01DRAFT_636042 [Geopyxis carbonaria]|nr:hypothetical protein EDC01DRAFT_636042 [Geopyxis carbonaria]